MSRLVSFDLLVLTIFLMRQTKNFWESESDTRFYSAAVDFVSFAQFGFLRSGGFAESSAQV